MSVERKRSITCHEESQSRKEFVLPELAARLPAQVPIRPGP